MHAFLSIHSKQWAPGSGPKSARKVGDESPKPAAGEQKRLGKERKKQHKKHSTSPLLVLVSSSSELMSAGPQLLYPKPPLLPIAVCNYYKQKRDGKRTRRPKGK